MKKIPSLFKRDFKGDRLAYNEVTPGCEWVLNGEGIPTIKWDGTACAVIEGRLYKRYDRKFKKGCKNVIDVGVEHFKAEPPGWIGCIPVPDKITMHWPGWVPVRDDDPADQWHMEAWLEKRDWVDGTYELVGPKINGNHHNFMSRHFRRHGGHPVKIPDYTLSYNGLKYELEYFEYEGVVWHHPDGRMAKIKRRDFGFQWPI